MAGESILVIDESIAVQDIAQTVLANAGFRVTTAGNGAAALACPTIEDVDMVVMGSDLAGLDGEETLRILKQHGQTHPIPVLLLVPEDGLPERESLGLGGACGFLLKPFSAEDLARKVSQVIEQGDLDELARQYLTSAADSRMNDLADQQINKVIERKTELIIERCIQKVTSAVDQRARAEVDQRVNALANEKEQELVKLTVREVANSMVEKLAASKVEEAMERILTESTDRAVRRTSDQMLPNLIRDRVKEMVANIVPREIERRLDKAAEQRASDLSKQIIEMVEGVARKNVPRAAREILPGVAESQVSSTLDKLLPPRVSDLVEREVAAQIASRLEPMIGDAAKRLRRSVLMFNGLFVLVLGGLVGVLVWLTFFHPGG
jgi:CheY-like chemotaxis protein